MFWGENFFPLNYLDHYIVHCVQFIMLSLFISGIERPTDVTTTAEPTKETFTPYIIIIIILVVLCIIFASLLIVALMVQCCRQKSVLSPTPEYGPHVDLTQYNDQRETRVDGTNSSTSSELLVLNYFTSMFSRSRS